MKISSRALRLALLLVLVTLAGVAWGPSIALAACANGSNQFVIRPGVCCANNAQQWKGQSCLFGVWHDNGAIQCHGPCAF